VGPSTDTNFRTLCDETPAIIAEQITSRSIPLLDVILGGISICFPTYFMVSTGKSLSRKFLQYEGAFEHRHAQASVKTGLYLITR
jgi:hypothetical protein